MAKDPFNPVKQIPTKYFWWPEDFYNELGKMDIGQICVVIHLNPVPKPCLLVISLKIKELLGIKNNQF